jgi:hypothetical protein
VEASEQRALWRREWLAILWRFARADADATFGELVGSYVWDADVLLDDRGYEPFVSKGFLSEAEATAAAAFHKLLSDHANNIFDWDDWPVAADPVWPRIVDAAQAAVAALRPLTTDAEEARLLRI